MINIKTSCESRAQSAALSAACSAQAQGQDSYRLSRQFLLSFRKHAMGGFFINTDRQIISLIIQI